MQSIYQSPEQNLANAIVLQAVTDYRNALKGISYSRRQPPEKVIKEVKKFFRSEWYRLLTKVDSEFLIRELEKEHLERSRNESNPNSIDT